MSTARSFLEKISRGLTFRRTLITDQGKRQLWVTPEASLRYWLPGSPNSDPELRIFINQFVKPGDVVWDIGANVGTCAFLASAASGNTGHIYCFEPDCFLGSLLSKTSQQSPSQDAPVTVIPLAVSDSVGYAEFVIPERSRSSNHLSSNKGCSQAGPPRYRQQVMKVTLDRMLETTPEPSVIKLDIEGEEYRALAGATRLLQIHRPVLLIEVWESIADEITSLLAESDYKLYDAHELPNKIPVSRACWSTLALPLNYSWPGENSHV